MKFEMIYYIVLEQKAKESIFIVFANFINKLNPYETELIFV